MSLYAMSQRLFGYKTTFDSVITSIFQEMEVKGVGDGGGLANSNFIFCPLILANFS